MTIVLIAQFLFYFHGAGCQQHLHRWPDPEGVTRHDQVLLTLHEEPNVPETRLHVST